MKRHFRPRDDPVIHPVYQTRESLFFEQSWRESEAPAELNGELVLDTHGSAGASPSRLIAAKGRAQKT